MIKIGKKYLFLVLLNFFIINLISSIEIELTDKDGKIIKNPKAGQEFILNIKGDYKELNQNYLDITGLDNFNIIDKQKSYNNITKQINYYFILTTQNIGQYNIAIRDSSNKILKSFKINIKSSLIKIFLNIEKNNIYENQKIPITLKIIYKDSQDLEFNQLYNKSETENFKIDFTRNLKRYKEKINNKLYNVIEYYGYLYARKAGKITISNLIAEFIRKYKYKNSFMLFTTTKTEYFSNQPINLEIKKLPDNSENINIVGTFNNFVINLEKNTVNQFEPLIMSISLTGDTDFQNIEKLNLNLPDSIKYFDPKTNLIKENNDNIETKKFDYVIQPIKAGIIEIPNQIIRYFDPEKETYTKIESNSVKLIVNAIATNNNNLENSNNIDIEKENKNNIDLEIENIYKKYEKEIKIPWLIFYILLLLPIIVIAYYKKENLKKYFKNIKYKYFSYLILQNTIRKIKKLEKEKSTSRLYFILKDALSRYITKEDKELSDEEILNVLYNNNIDKNIIEKYIELNNELLNYTKYSYIKSEVNNKEIFQKARSFIKLLKKYNLKYLIIFSIIFGCSFKFIYSNNIDKNNNLENIVKLYKAKKYASNKDIKKINNFIKEIKEENLENLKENKLYLIFNFIPLLFWQIIFIILWIIFIFTLFAYNNFIIKAIIFNILILNTFAIFTIDYQRSKKYGILKTDQVSIYLGPDQNFPKKSDINYLDAVEILNNKINKNNLWYYIKVNSINGWVKSENLEIIN